MEVVRLEDYRQQAETVEILTDLLCQARNNKLNGMFIISDVLGGGVKRIPKSSP